MSRDAVDKYFDELKEYFRQLVRETVAEEMEPIRDVLLRPAGDASPPPVPELVDAVKVAEIIGEDISTDRARKRAKQRVYHMARCGLIPSVRLSVRRIRFDPVAVRRWLDEKSLGTPAPAAPRNACQDLPR